MSASPKRLCVTGAILAVACGVVASACIVGERPVVANLECGANDCVCSEGYGDCDGIAGNGCEALLELDQRNCGSCGMACTNALCDGGQCVCNTGYVDCNQQPEDGCEAQLGVDAQHCGACDHSCFGGTCSDSRCAPFLVVELGTFIYNIAANDRYVFYCEADAGVIYSVDVASGEVALLAADQYCWAVAASEDVLFWSVTENGDHIIRSVPVQGGAMKTVAISLDVSEYEFAVEDDTVIWTEHDSAASIDRIRTAQDLAHQTTIVESTATIEAIAVANGRVYWLEDDGTTSFVRVAPIAGGPSKILVTKLDDEATFENIVAVGDMLYWLQTDSEGKSHFIMRVPASGGAEEQLYARNRQADELLGDASGLYWIEDLGDRLLRAPLDGGEVEELAKYQHITTPALGADTVLWIDYPSHLFAVAK